MTFFNLSGKAWFVVYAGVDGTLAENTKMIANWKSSGLVGVAYDTYDPFFTANLGGHGRILSASIESAAGGQTITGFKVQAQAHPDGAWSDYLVDTDFDSVYNSNMRFCSDTGPHELAAEGVALIRIDCRGLHAIRFQAKVASGTATLSADATAGA